MVREENILKATGIVRRIDELGRVVVPKEIRRTMRIREGDTMEIFTDREGEVILKKYSPIGELGDFAREFTESMHRAFGHICAVCDKDVFISVSGGARRELLDKAIHKDIERLIKGRERVMLSRNTGDALLDIAADDEANNAYTAQVIHPILSDGDSIGAVIMLSRDEDMVMSQAEFKVCETGAHFLGKLMEA
jgi:AbrB family transcriptional regulator (stage V sporulation protein T)